MDEKKLRPLVELLDEVRDIDGFPIAKDEDILELSNPPYYTACPNPYIKYFIDKYGKGYVVDQDLYDRKPFVEDVSVGKNDPIYNAHSYHTKVPHKAIEKFIEHYTEPGDIVFDGFSGTGMTGVAAQQVGRKAILSDLSPVASFISYNYNHPVNPHEFKKEALQILKEVMEECSWMYETNHIEDEIKEKSLYGDNSSKGTINYIVWSDIFECPYCNKEHTFFEVAFDEQSKSVRKKYKCPFCQADISKKECQNVYESVYDNVLQKEIEIIKEKPILINYSVGKKSFNKKPDEDDFKILEEIDKLEIPYWFPRNRMAEGEETRRNDKYGIRYVHQFYSKRALYSLSKIFNLLEKSNSHLKSYLIYTFEQAVLGMSRIARYVPTHYSQVNQYLSGTLYMASQRVDVSPKYVLENKIKRLTSVLKKINKFGREVIVSNQSITHLKQIPNEVIDYIFTDPPFGSNLMYSELNFLHESWLKVATNNKKEAIVNKVQNKNLEEYTELMTGSFKEMYRILKPNRWITIVFHNSKASVWNSIQESITRAGFIIAQVSILDKKQGSFKQINSAGAVKNDLIINAYKPKKEFQDQFLKNSGEGMETEFIKQQLDHLPIASNIERTEQMLYSKMLAHYIENGFKIKYNASNFYSLLHDNFAERDGYWFLEYQAEEYSSWKSSLRLDELDDITKGSQVLFVVDEKSALVWIYNFLDEPKDYGVIFTNYEQVATRTDDEIPELKNMLDRNFIKENGKYRRPISKQEKAEIAKNRDRELDKAWKDLLDKAKNGKRKIKNVRKEALVHGFTKCYQEENYQDILTVAESLYTSTLESSGDIMDFVDIARIKLGG